MGRKKYRANQIMTVAQLKRQLTELAKEAEGDFEIWLSCDEEGNEFLPMLKNTRFSLAVDKGTKRVIFFPSHR